MARIMTYDPDVKVHDVSSKDIDMRPMPPDGDHLAIVETIGDPSHKNDRWSFAIKLGIVNMDACITIWIECDSDGQPALNWRGEKKWQQFCEALALKPGQYQDTAFYGCSLKIAVKTTKKGDKEYKNVTKMWQASQGENDKAADWLSKKL